MLGNVLKYVISADPSQYEKAMDSVKQKTEAVGDAIGKAFAAGAVMIAGAAAGMVVMAKETLTMGDRIHKLNLQLGISTEYLGQLRHVTALSGVEFEATAKSIRVMQVNVGDAAQGIGTAKDALAELHISARKLKELSPEMQFEAIAKAMEGITNVGDRTRLAADIFGGRGVEMLQIMSGGAKGIRDMREEADRLGLSMSQTAANDIAKFNDDIARNKAAVMGSVEAMTIALLPTLDKVSVWAGEYIPKAIQAAIDAYNWLSQTSVEAVVGVTAGLAQFYDLLGKLPGALGEPYRDAAAALREFNAEFVTFQAHQIEAFNTPKEGGSTFATPELPDVGGDDVAEAEKAKEDARLAALDLKKPQELDYTDFWMAQQQERYEVQARFLDMQVQDEQNAADFKKRVRDQAFNDTISGGKMLLSSVLSGNRTAFEAMKAFEMAKVMISAPSAIMAAYNNGMIAGGPYAGPYLAVAYAAAAAVFSAGQIAEISSQNMGGGGGSIGIPTASATTAPMVDISSTQGSSGLTDTEQRGSLKINIQGDILGDEGFIDTLVARINQAEDRDVYVRNSRYAGALA